MPNKNHPITWVVVADNCQAKIFRSVKFPKLEEVAYLEHPESRLHNQDLISSKPGRSGQRVSNTRYSYQPETEPRQLEAMKFAVDLSKYLSSAEREGQFQQLYLLAEPSFLGILRQHLSPDIKKLIIAELAKELISCDTATIESHVAQLRF